MRFQTVGDYARHAFPLHRAVGGDELRADGHTIVAHYSEPMKAVRVLETAGHEFGHLELALVRLDVRSVPAGGRRAERPPPCRELAFEGLFDVHDAPPEVVGVVVARASAQPARVAVRTWVWGVEEGAPSLPEERVFGAAEGVPLLAQPLGPEVVSVEGVAPDA